MTDIVDKNSSLRIFVKLISHLHKQQSLEAWQLFTTRLMNNVSDCTYFIEEWLSCHVKYVDIYVNITALESRYGDMVQVITLVS